MHWLPFQMANFWAGKKSNLVWSVFFHGKLFVFSLSHADVVAGVQMETIRTGLVMLQIHFPTSTRAEPNWLIASAYI